MRPVERVGLVAGVISALASAYSFAVGIQSPFNYVLVAITAILFFLAGTWHYLPRLRRASSGPKRILDVSTIVKPGRHHYFRERFASGDVIRISIVSTGMVDCYVLDIKNYH